MKHVEDVVKCDWKYAFGAKGVILSRNQIKDLQNKYGKSKVWDSDLNKAGKICCDCSGLISSLTKIHRSSEEYFNTAVAKKSISEKNSSMRGQGAWKNGHIGVFDGNNGYYAMDGSKRNAVHLDLFQSSFTHIIKLCDVDY